jgi:hypothetical protein
VAPVVGVAGVEVVVAQLVPDRVPPLGHEYPTVPVAAYVAVVEVVQV